MSTPAHPTSPRWVYPRGTLDVEEFQTAVTRDLPGWRHTSLRETYCVPEGFVTHSTGDEEVVVVPISGSWDVEVDGEQHRLRGRASVWSGPTDVLYVPPGRTMTVTNVGEVSGQVALCGAVVAGPCDRAVAYVAAEKVPVELRGAGQATREVRNFAVPGVLDAERIIACEVITPAGNWSSWPAHRHDREIPGQETALEEIYWFLVDAEDGAPRQADPAGYLRMHSRSRADLTDGEAVQPTLAGEDPQGFDIVAEVRSGDTVLVPFGWHGPAMAPPGYDLYYLNVMAGPGPERAWLICDDPAHAWVRSQWPGRAQDLRLPMGGQ